MPTITITGLLPKKDTGFSKDKISNGMTTIMRKPDGSYDILFVDVTKKIISSVDDGGTVVALWKGSRDASFAVFYGGVTEIYTVWHDNDGNMRYDHLMNKGGNSTYHKSSVMTGTCSEINLKVMK